MLTPEAKGSMSAYELLDLALSLNNRIDTHWALFISVHLALIGGIIYVDQPLSKHEKSATVVIYAGFALINYYMMKGQALFLENIYMQIEAIKDDACCKANHVINHVVTLINKKSVPALKFSIIAVHVVMFVVMVLSIFFDSSKPQENKDRKTT